MPTMPMITHIRLHPRESGSAVVAHWQTYAGNFKDLALQTVELDCGDYDLGADVRVERKSATDFSLAVMDKRLYGEVGKLKASADQVVYIVEGDLFAGRFHSDTQRLHEALAWLSVIQGVALVPSPDPAVTAEMLFCMAGAAQHGMGQPPVMRNGKPFDPRSGQTYMVEGLPGVTPALAQALLQHFGSAAAVCAASAEQLAQTPGMGASTAQRVRKVLDAPYVVKQ